MSNFPQLETQRLELGNIYYEDLPSFAQKANNKSISDNTLTFPHPYTIDNAIFWYNLRLQSFQNGTAYIFAIRLKETREVMGGIGLHLDKQFNRAELGYWVAEEYWNNGYVTEAVGEILRYGFEDLNLNKIFATHFSHNPASGKVMIKNGMIKEGVLKEHILKNGKYLDLTQYRLTKTEWSNLEKNKS